MSNLDIVIWGLVGLAGIFALCTIAISGAKKYKANMRKVILNHFSTEWVRAENICATILWNCEDMTREFLLAELPKMATEGLLEFRYAQPVHSGTLGEYRLSAEMATESRY